ncbi:Brix domain protein [Ceratobasidium sp. AG-Ba]|nr:Brix domain protein [Ceratobasidium sp. AG-Ba]
MISRVTLAATASVMGHRWLCFDVTGISNQILKPRNAASKRALEARAPREIEDEKTVIFVKGTHVGERVTGVMKDLMALKRPHAIAFNKKNEIRPFEDTSSLDFWSNKNDAAIHVRIGCSGIYTHERFSGPKSTPGHRPLVHFASQLFDTHPRYVQLRSLLLDLFGAAQIDAIHLAGIEHVICVSTAPVPPSLASNTSPESTDNTPLPTIHIRTYTTRLLASGVHPDPAVWSLAMRQPKLKKKDVESGLGKKRKNIDVDEMGDVRGRVHIARQDLGKLQTRR